MEIIKNKRNKSNKEINKEIKGGETGSISRICENTKQIVHGGRTTISLNLQLLDCVNCKEHYKKLYKKYKDYDYKRKSDSLERKEQSILMILLNRGFEIPIWLYKYLG